MEQLFAQLREPVYRYVIGIVDSPAEAEDIAQEAFLRLFAALRKGEKIRLAPAWVFRTAYNLAIDRCRAQGKTEPLEPGVLRRVPLGATPATQERQLREAERARKLEQALELLSPQERRCLDLRAEGLRFREIAAALEVGISTVETFLARAVKKLSKEIHV